MKITKKSKSRSVPSLSRGGSQLDEDQPPAALPYNYCSKDFPPLLGGSAPVSECSSSELDYQSMTSMGPVITPPSPETHSMPEVGGGGDACGNVGAPTSHPHPRTIFNMNGVVQMLPASMLADQYGLAALLIGQLQERFPVDLPDKIAKEVWDDGNEGYYSSKFFKSTVPTVVTDSPPSSQPWYYNVSSYMFQRQPGGGPEDQDIPRIQKAWTLKPELYCDDLLFYLFYTFTQDMLQMTAAKNLYCRGWRYHIQGQIWIKPINQAIYRKETDSTRDIGIFQIFDFHSWKVVERELRVGCEDVEGQPY